MYSRHKNPITFGNMTKLTSCFVYLPILLLFAVFLNVPQVFGTAEVAPHEPSDSLSPSGGRTIENNKQMVDDDYIKMIIRKETEEKFN